MITKVTKSISNDRNYERYVNQEVTGRNATLNCGPSSMAMVAKWLHEYTTIKTGDIADKYIPYETTYNGVGTLTLSRWLGEYGISSRRLSDISEKALVKEIDEDNIIIVGLDLKYISYNPNIKQRAGQYVNPDPSKSCYHYVVV